MPRSRGVYSSRLTQLLLGGAAVGEQRKGNRPVREWGGAALLATQV